MAIDMAVYMAERRASRRAILIEKFGSKCQKCGSTGNLEFNHLDRASKSFVLSGCHLDKSWTAILAEAAKCELVCKSCHDVYTKEQYARGEIVPSNKNTSEYLHGTVRTYTEINCRCARCRKAKKAYRAKTIHYTEQIT